VAFGITTSTPDTFAAGWESEDGNTVTQVRHETLEILCSFYGPNAGANEQRLRQGLGIEQNRVGLAAADIAVVSVTGPVIAPALIKEVWVKRVDCTLNLSRSLNTTYEVRSVVGISTATLDNELYLSSLHLEDAP
jgi:hypothetical protein